MVSASPADGRGDGVRAVGASANSWSPRRPSATTPAGRRSRLELGESSQVVSGSASCRAGVEPDEQPARWTAMRTTLSNANPRPVTVRLHLGSPGTCASAACAARGSRTGRRWSRSPCRATAAARSPGRCARRAPSSASRRGLSEGKRSVPEQISVPLLFMENKWDTTPSVDEFDATLGN
jgi:hypothetical protein